MVTRFDTRKQFEALHTGTALILRVGAISLAIIALILGVSYLANQTNKSNLSKLRSDLEQTVAEVTGLKYDLGQISTANTDGEFTTTQIDHIIEQLQEKQDILIVGPQGVPGKDGIDGKDGADGQDGVPGIDGADGKDGVDGRDGEDGQGSVPGPKGDKGDKGDTGDKGEKGDKGDTGAEGATGAKGDQGDKGDKGDRGDKGDKGDSGILAVAGGGLNLSTTTLSLETCSNGQILKTNGSVYACANDNDTTYTANGDLGLVLDGTAFGLRTCADNEVLKYSTSAQKWQCQADNNDAYDLSGYLQIADLDQEIQNLGTYYTKTEVNNLLNQAMSTVPAGGLKVPQEAALESGLSAASCTASGDYFYVQNMDVTRPGHTGRAWCYDDNGTMKLYKVYDDYMSSDGTTIITSGGYLTVSTTWLDGYLNGKDYATETYVDDAIANITYTAGDGLTLSSNVFSIDADTCTAGQYSVWNGSKFICQDDQDTDTNTDAQTLSFDDQTCKLTIAGGNVVTLNCDSGGTYTAGTGINIDQNGEISVAYIDANTGDFIFQNASSDTKTSFAVKNSQDQTAFYIDTINSQVAIGNGATADQIAFTLVLDSFSDGTSADPVTLAVNGAMYYNADKGKFRCYENNRWKDCIGGSSVTINYLAPDDTGDIKLGAHDVGTYTDHEIEQKIDEELTFEHLQPTSLNPTSVTNVAPSAPDLADPAFVQIGSDLYVFGGFTCGSSCTSRTFRREAHVINLVSGATRSLPNIPATITGDVTYIGGAYHPDDNSIYVIGGPTNSFRFDVATETYTPLTGGSHAAVSTTAATIYADNGKILIFQGPYGNATNHIVEYDIATDTSAIVATAPGPGNDATAVRIGDYVYVVVGCTVSGGVYHTANFAYKYQISTQTVTPIATPPASKFESFTIAIADRIYFVAGKSTNLWAANNTIYEYNLTTNSWRVLSNTAPYTYGLGYFGTFNNNLYLFGGWNAANNGHLVSGTAKMNFPLGQVIAYLRVGETVYANGSLRSDVPISCAGIGNVTALPPSTECTALADTRIYPSDNITSGWVRRGGTGGPIQIGVITPTTWTDNVVKRNGETWLKLNGQTIDSTQYPSLNFGNTLPDYGTNAQGQYYYVKAAGYTNNGYTIANGTASGQVLMWDDNQGLWVAGTLGNGRTAAYAFGGGLNYDSNTHEVHLALIDAHTGNFIFKNTQGNTNSVFSVTDSADTLLFNVDAVSGLVQIGSTTADNSAVALVLDSSTVEPANPVNGMMYYDTNLAKFRCYESDEWKNCITAPNALAANHLADRPDLWVTDTEYDLGNGLYGQRFTGTLSITTANQADTQVLINSQINDLIDSGGWIKAPDDTSVKHQINMPITTLTDHTDIGASRLEIHPNGQLVIWAQMNVIAPSIPYDIWIKYTK
jgi:hypothetical protein